jgi:hypothetical protein
MTLTCNYLVLRNRGVCAVNVQGLLLENISPKPVNRCGFVHFRCRRTGKWVMILGDSPTVGVR